MIESQQEIDQRLLAAKLDSIKFSIVAEDMGQSERRCFICGVAFNMARLRCVTEPVTAAWDHHRGFWRPDAYRYGAEEHRKRFDTHYVDGQIVGYTSNGKYKHFRIDGEGIDPGSVCEAAGCSEEDLDHACGDFTCEYILSEGNKAEEAYNGWRITVEEMKIMTCVQAVVPVGGHRAPGDDEHEDEDEDERTSRHRCTLTAISESAPNEFDAGHVPYRRGVGGLREDVMIFERGGSDEDLGVPFHAPCFQVLKKITQERDFTASNLLDALVDLRNVS